MLASVHAKLEEHNIEIEEHKIEMEEDIFQETKTCVQIIIPIIEGENVEMCKKTKFQDTRTCVHIYARTV